MLIETLQEKELYSLASVRMALRLEIVGMKVSRNINGKKEAQHILNTKEKDRKKLLAMVQDRIDFIKSNLVN